MSKVTLISGENTKFTTGLHLFDGLFPVVGFGVLGLGSFGAGLWPLGLLLLGASVWKWFAFKAHQYVITDLRVIVQSGLLQTTSREIMLSKVESVDVQRGFIDKVNYKTRGTVVIRGSGGTPEFLKNIDQAEQFKGHLLTQINELRKRAS